MILYNSLIHCALIIMAHQLSNKRKNKMIDTKTIIHLNTPNFDKTIKKGLVLVDFWAEWCAPCRIQNSILEDIVSEMEGKVIIAKLNVDENRQIATRYSIRSIPTLLLFYNSKITRQFIGVQQKQTIINAINQYL